MVQKFWQSMEKFHEEQTEICITFLQIQTKTLKNGGNDQNLTNINGKREDLGQLHLKII
jgi:hypothetical protein